MVLFMDTTNPPLTTGQVARLFHVSSTTVQRWAERGLLPSFRTLGGQLRFHEHQVRALLAEQFTAEPAPAYDAVEG